MPINNKNSHKSHNNDLEMATTTKKRTIIGKANLNDSLVARKENISKLAVDRCRFHFAFNSLITVITISNLTWMLSVCSRSTDYNMCPCMSCTISWTEFLILLFFHREIIMNFWWIENTNNFFFPQKWGEKETLGEMTSSSDKRLCYQLSTSASYVISLA